MNDTLNFANEEFSKYASKVFTDYDKNAKIYIGLPNGEISNSEDEDEIYIDVKEGTGKIIGSNPGAVLIAVYQFFKEIGCRFLRPGKNGEYLISCKLSEINVFKQYKASYEMRGVVIEGACSYENVYDMIDFSPKVGLNRYRFQFKESFVFFERWYNHLLNPLKKSEDITPEQTFEMVQKLKGEVRKRGMKVHAMGHGWTTEPLGLLGTGWHNHTGEISEDIKKYFAEINGIRKLTDNKPFSTQLCYSNPKVKELMVEHMVRYAKNNPDVDFIHFALADSINNCCECENCKNHRVSDFVIDILNMADERLTEENLPHKIVFGAYLDTMWPPVENKLKNIDRFRFQFCPMTRVYYKSYPNNNIPENEPSPYITNKLVIPTKVEDNLAYLKQWQKVSPVKSYVGEYHYMWDYSADIGAQQLSNVLCEDIKKLVSFDMNGMFMFQSQRNSVPTAIGLYTFANALWDNSLTFEEISKDYFKHSFGDGWEDCYSYLQTLSDKFDMKLRRADRNYNVAECLSMFKSCLEDVEIFKGKYENKNKFASETEKLSWFYLKIYNKYLVKLLTALILAAEGKADEGKEIIDKVVLWLFEIEDSIQIGMDVFLHSCNIKKFYRTLVEGKSGNII